MSSGAIRTLALATLICAAVAGIGRAEVVQRDGVRVTFEGRLSPQKLPRHGTAAVTVGVEGNVKSIHDPEPPPLRRVEIAINRHGRFDYAGLPACTLEEIQPSTTENAKRACGDSQVGVGSFSANVGIPGQAPFPSSGKLVAFNGVEDGRPVIFAHVYGTEPVPTSFTLTLRFRHLKGTFGTVLTTTLPQVAGRAGFITGLGLTLHRNFTYRGRTHSYLSAGCPAPEGFSGAVFPLAKVSFSFKGGRTLTSTLTRSCKVRG